MAAPAAQWYRATMKLLILTFGLLLLFGGGGFFLAGLAIGAEVVGVILLMSAVIYLVGGFRAKV